MVGRIRQLNEIRRREAQIRAHFGPPMMNAPMNAPINPPGVQFGRPPPVPQAAPAPVLPPDAVGWDFPWPLAAPPMPAARAPPLGLPVHPADAFRGGAGLAPGIRQRMPQPFAPLSAPPPLGNANHPYRLGAPPEVKPLDSPRQKSVELGLDDYRAVDDQPPENVGIGHPLQGYLRVPLVPLSPGRYLPPQQLYPQQPVAAQQPRIPQPPPRAPLMPFQPGSAVNAPPEPRGRNALEPIDLSSPHSVVDLTGEEFPMSNGRRQEARPQRVFIDLVGDDAAAEILAGLRDMSAPGR